MNTVAELAQKLISFPSVTPNHAGCLDFIQSYLTNLGFDCWRLPFGEVDNLYARWGQELPNFCFAGHVDVVPVQNPSIWQDNPFLDQLADNGHVYGRGAVDMKGAIAAFMIAVTELLKEPLTGSISFLLTSDEEGIAINGTRKVVEWLQEKGETISLCLVGEPTSVRRIGDMIKIGRRGSLNVRVVVEGQAGHIAYPENFINPNTILLEYLTELKREPLDEGTEFFQPSNLEITSIDVGNTTTNVVPAKAEARFNIRFNSLHSGESLTQHLKEVARRISSRIHLETRLSAEPFYCSEESIASNIAQAVEAVTGQLPTLSTSGGTSDARFIKDIAPVIEVGLLNQTAHQDDEHVSIEDLETLQAIYAKILDSVLAKKWVEELARQSIKYLI
ncbi:MAG: succinyl-diaminopimelate desuccinylase [Candidatus Paracaedibacteraceae bacterium]|nr:succinyl-diaminopimelate desuccinylase [Candidatus Paracaedibacteraceae bacterium]